MSLPPCLRTGISADCCSLSHCQLLGVDDDEKLDDKTRTRDNYTQLK